MTVIWHNPRCSKSRQTLALLEESGIVAKLRMYLKEPPTEDEIRQVLSALNMTASQIVRRGEAKFKELDLNDADDDTLINAMSSHPILIERPIVVHGGAAALGRPPENVLGLF